VLIKSIADADDDYKVAHEVGGKDGFSFDDFWETKLFILN
jgi:hypothetical protein